MDTARPKPVTYTLHSFAALVKQLRTVQKASGVGYKTPAAGTSAKPLEQQVDSAIAWVAKHRFPLDNANTDWAVPASE